MSRSGYSDDCENLSLWRQAVARAINGKRGQQFLRELAATMDAMPAKRLVAHSFQEEAGEFCTLGTVGAARGIDLAPLEDADPSTVGATFGIAQAMAAEIMFMNDDYQYGEWCEWEVEGPQRDFYPHWERHERRGYREPACAPEEFRWQRMRKWVASQIKNEGAAA